MEVFPLCNMAAKEAASRPQASVSVHLALHNAL